MISPQLEDLAIRPAEAVQIVADLISKVQKTSGDSQLVHENVELRREIDNLKERCALLTFKKKVFEDRLKDELLRHEESLGRDKPRQTDVIRPLNSEICNNQAFKTQTTLVENISAGLGDCIKTLSERLDKISATDWNPPSEVKDSLKAMTETIRVSKTRLLSTRTPRFP